MNLFESYKKRISVLAGLSENFTVATSNDLTVNEKYIVGNYVKFNYFINDLNGNLPYRFIGKIIDNSKFNRLYVEVITQVKQDNSIKTVDLPSVKPGDTMEIHVGNVVSSTSNLGHWMSKTYKP